MLLVLCSCVTLNENDFESSFKTIVYDDDGSYEVSDCEDITD